MVHGFIVIILAIFHASLLIIKKWKDRREVDNTVALVKLDEVLGQIKGVE